MTDVFPDPCGPCRATKIGEDVLDLDGRSGQGILTWMCWKIVNAYISNALDPLMFCGVTVQNDNEITWRDARAYQIGTGQVRYDGTEGTDLA